MTQFQKHLSLTANNILSVMTKEDRSMSKSELAKAIGVTFQTVSNNMHVLLAQGLIEEHYRKSNAQYYKLGDPSMSLVHIYWREISQPLDTIVRDYASGKSPVGNLSQFSRGLLKIFSEMYRISADAIDDDNPKPITLAQMKELQSSVARMRINLKQLLATCESLLENDNLWNPAEIVNQLLIKPQDMNIESARSIAQNISEKLNAK